MDAFSIPTASTRRRDLLASPALALFLALFASQSGVLVLSPILSDVADDFGVSIATAGQLRIVAARQRSRPSRCAPRRTSRGAQVLRRGRDPGRAETCGEERIGSAASAVAPPRSGADRQLRDRHSEVVGDVAQDRRQHEHAGLAREQREEERERRRREQVAPTSRGRGYGERVHARRIAKARDARVRPAPESVGGLPNPTPSNPRTELAVGAAELGAFCTDGWRVTSLLVADYEVGFAGVFETGWCFVGALLRNSCASGWDFGVSIWSVWYSVPEDSEVGSGGLSGSGPERSSRAMTAELTIGANRFARAVCDDADKSGAISSSRGRTCTQLRS